MRKSSIVLLQQLALQMCAGRIVTQRTRGSIGGQADYCRREHPVAGICIIPADQGLQVRGPCRIFARQPRPSYQQICVIHGHPFAEPKTGRLLLWTIVQCSIFCRPDIHQIPGMRELVRDLFIYFRHVTGQQGGRRPDRDGVTMFQGAVDAAFQQKGTFLAADLFWPAVRFGRRSFLYSQPALPYRKPLYRLPAATRWYGVCHSP